jgi:methylglutaconyl-CoA hydratase
MNFETLSVQREGQVAVVLIDREAQKNSLSRQTVRDLGSCFRELAREEGVRAIILSGRGNRVFSAGADLKERKGMSDDEVRAQLGLYRTELSALDLSPKPVIAAVNGVALGGGMELALLCDLRVAAPHCEFALPETGLGIIPGAGGTQRLTRSLGEARAKELVLLGRRLDAATALSWGLINAVSPEGEDVVAFARAFARPIAEGAPIAQAAALSALDASFDLPLVEGLRVELECYERTLVSDDRKEALLAFAEKRPPRFRGC